MFFRCPGCGNPSAKSGSVLPTTMPWSPWRAALAEVLVSKATESLSHVCFDRVRHYLDGGVCQWDLSPVPGSPSCWHLSSVLALKGTATLQRDYSDLGMPHSPPDISQANISVEGLSSLPTTSKTPSKSFFFILGKHVGECQCLVL